MRGRTTFLLTIALLAIAASMSPAGAQTTPARSDTGSTTTVSGTVYDSISHEPLSGAQVQLVDPANSARIYSANSDTLGRFRIDAIPPGKYIAGFFHPSVDVLGMEPPLRSVAIKGAVANVVNLWIPASAQIMTMLCGKRTAIDSTGAMVGAVRNADSGLPVAGGNVVVSWLQLAIQAGKLVSNPHHVPVKTDENGTYRVCGLPGADTLLANAAIGAIESGVISVAIPPAGILRQDFLLGDSTSVIAVVTDSTASAEVQRETTVLRGTARLSGVVNGANHKPLADARVAVRGTGLETKTGADGRFALATLPAGTFSADVRAIGMEPQVIPVKLSTVVPASIEINMAKAVPELSRVLIYGKVPKARQDLLDFADRKRSGLGHYFTQDDPMLAHAFEVSNVLSMVPGVRVRSSGRFGHVIIMNGGCAATLYIDGFKLLPGFDEDVDDIPPSEIAGIEVYSGPLEAPAKFSDFSGCGVVLLWTKR